MKISRFSYISNYSKKTFKNKEKQNSLKFFSDGIHYDYLVWTFNTDLKMNHLKQKLFVKKEEPGMNQEINSKAEKLKGDLKQKARTALQWVLIIIYLVLLIFFVFKPLTDFLSMVEYTIKIGIVNYFIK